MNKEYLPKNIEFYVQEYWERNKTFQVQEDTKKEKYYCLPMLPYPSGKLHMGHVRNYTISDVIARYHRMLGKNVLHPIGWDAFGLPAEEAAIKNNIHPEKWTYENIKYMKKQLKSLGFSYDWTREITTCKPNYYKWEQWFFTQLYKKKLVYKKIRSVYWCPHDKTVLANEQVVNNCCWRCQNQVQTRKIPQWFMKIRKYAEALYQDLKKLNQWPEKVKNMQKNWIGRSKGFEITLDIFNSEKTIKVFTTRLDIIMGVTCVLISPSHKLSIELAKKNKKIKTFLEENMNVSQQSIEKNKYNGINTNKFSLHPITKTKIPIWITNFIIQNYGITSSLSVPGHNKDDWNFAIKNKLKIKYVIINADVKKHSTPSLFTEKKGKLYNSQEFNGLNFEESTKKVRSILFQKKIIRKKIHYKLQDWCISRQRYWGTPIPMATLKNKKIVPIPSKDLPVLLQKIKKNTFLNSSSTHFHSKQNTVYINQEKAVRETDTFDTFIESSWYYARYTCPNFNTGMLNPVALKYWLPIDQYVGGIEHAIMHLIYLRFFHKLLRDFKFLEFDEPVKNLLCQGMVLAETFYTIDKNSQKKWVNSSLVSTKRDAKGKIITAHINNGQQVIYAGMTKMSKSKNNGVEPELIIKNYGADTIRLFMMFAAPIESSLEWTESGVKGIHRFLKKLWTLIFNYFQIKNTHKNINFNNLNNQQCELRYFLHETIHKVSNDMNNQKTFNTAIAAIMKLVNRLIKAPMETDQDKSIMQESLMCVIKMLYPFTPHFCFIIWGYFNKNSCIDYETWPIFNKKILLKQSYVIVVQINGKKQCTINISNNLNKEEIYEYAKNQIIIIKKLKKSLIKNIIYIPKKVINFVIVT
ncbi:MAG: leucine--tRNA ligase [Buchnera aphidicola (Pentalonia nigronervosa)]|jgi:leucyl-tRNA synthetase|uniref:Leucine--tRNA ligase n=1 Tax=Buchnera aphidicola (Pentalonia nigronervosa) TaxID=1309793 RepID=A0A7H1AYT3_9GAMM|nr:MAG: leucine--tRNA ligase [Buchnera aphidicola (Pentalonia nigronervosa)]